MIALPGSDKFDQSWFMESLVQYLRNSVEVRNEHTLQNDAHIGGEEKFDIVCLLVAREPLMNDCNLGGKFLEIDEDAEYDKGTKQLR